MGRATDRRPFAGARWAKGMDPESTTSVADAIREAARRRSAGPEAEEQTPGRPAEEETSTAPSPAAEPDGSGGPDAGSRERAARSRRRSEPVTLDRAAVERDSRRRRAEREALERESRPRRLEREAVQRMAVRQAAGREARRTVGPVAVPASGDAVRPGEVPVVELRNASKVYEGGVVGLDRVNLRIGRGEFVFLVGATGCGKSTFVRLLLRELEPTTGRVLISGHDLGEMPRRKVPRLRRNIGTVFQDFKLLPNRTVYDNVAYSLQVIGESRRSIRRKVPDILRLVGLASKVRSYPDELSGGEQQRVSIARAFVNHPPLLLADEPTGNLDPETSIGIMQLIYRINRTGTTVIVATHDHEMVDKMRRRVIELRTGRVVRDQPSGLYRPVDESTMELGIRLRGELGLGVEGHPN